jgi:hypothetical protein
VRDASGKLILIELNEVPFRVMDAFCRERPDSTLAQILRRSQQFETITADRLALDPWISWPTLHRGVPDEQHNILHLGQVLTETDRKYPPIWRLLKERGLRVGVFGSLHSSSLPPDVREYDFYLPDYFDQEAFAHPPELLAFQELNLSMTRESARNVTRRIPLKSVAKVLASAPALGLRLSTLADSAMHLARETVNRGLRIRRRAYQPLITMDLFLERLRRTKPHFATFYTNHVAAAMHRYWGAAFPEDYDDERLGERWIRRYRGEISFAMEKFDSMLAAVSDFVDENREYGLMIASSMGQAAIPATRTYEFLTINDVARFMAALGIPREGWQPRPAMVPCCCVLVQEQYRELIARGLESMRIGGSPSRRDPRPVAPFSYDERERGFFQFFVQFDNYEGPDRVSIGETSLTLAEVGLGMMAHEDGVNCTAQHVPVGSLVLYGKRVSANAGARRTGVSTLDVAPSILEFFGFEPPAYMQGVPSIGFEQPVHAT